MSDSGPCTCALAFTRPHRSNRCFFRVAKRVVGVGQILHQELSGAAGRDTVSNPSRRPVAPGSRHVVDEDSTVVVAEASFDPISGASVSPPSAEITAGIDDIDDTPTAVDTAHEIDEHSKHVIDSSIYLSKEDSLFGSLPGGPSASLTGTPTAGHLSSGHTVSSSNNINATDPIMQEETLTQNDTDLGPAVASRRGDRSHDGRSYGDRLGDDDRYLNTEATSDCIVGANAGGRGGPEAASSAALDGDGLDPEDTSPAGRVREAVRSRVVDAILSPAIDPCVPCTCYFARFSPHRVKACTFRTAVRVGVDIADNLIMSTAQRHLQGDERGGTAASVEQNGEEGYARTRRVSPVVAIDPEAAAREAEVLRRFLVVEAAIAAVLVVCLICMSPFYLCRVMGKLGIGGVFGAIQKSFASFSLQIKTTTALLTLYLLHHRLLAFLVCHAVRRVAGGSWSAPEAFNIDCEWMSLRLGLDESELIVSGFVWANSSAYTKYRTFIDAKTLRVSCSTAALLSWFVYDEPLVLNEVYVDSCNVYLVRKKDTGVFNYDAAIGSNKRTRISREIRDALVSHVTASVTPLKKRKVPELEEFMLALNRLVLIGLSVHICGAQFREKFGLPRSRRRFHCDSLVLSERDWCGIERQRGAVRDSDATASVDEKNAGLQNAPNAFHASHLGKKVILAVISKYAEQYSDAVVSVLSSISMQKLTNFFRD